MIHFIRILSLLTPLLLCNMATAVDESTLLKPDLAFPIAIELQQSPQATAPNTIVVKWNIADNYYMYHDKIKLSMDEATGVTLGPPIFPPSTKMDDPAYGNVKIHRGLLIAKYPLIGYNTKRSLILKTKHQGCADVGVCYPPIKKSFDLKDLSVTYLHEPVAATKKQTAAPSKATAPTMTLELSEQDYIAKNLASNSIFLTFISFFGFGLLLAFTPCVFPMIPILSGIIIGQGKQLSTRHAFSLSLAYVLAMALAYTSVGVLAALFGTNLQIWFQNPWVLTSFAGIFVVLSLSMFGFYEMQMPAAIQNKLNKVSNRQEGGSLAGAALMGLLSAFIVGPCVTAPLIGALIYIGQTGDALMGGSALFALGLGMGAPLLVVGTSAGKLLPNAGAWMDVVKAVFGIMMLGVAVWLLSRVLPGVITQLLSAILIFVSAIYLGALRQHNSETTAPQLFWKGIGLTVLIYATLMIIGAATGKSNLLQPLASFAVHSGTQATENTGLKFQVIKSQSELNKVLAAARDKGQSVMLDFYADWCVSCKEMDETTFKDPSVMAALTNTLLLQADVTQNNDLDKQLLQHFDILGPPAIVFYDSSGQELKASRIVGYVPPTQFMSHLKKSLH